MDNLNGREFGPTLRRWFKSNGWPQGITQDWAYAVKSPNGPWASQISKSMNDKLEPKPDFFLSLGRFNQAVAERDLAGISDRRLIDRLRNGEPLCHDDGTPFDAPSFFSLFTGLIEAPKLPEPEQQLTQEDVDEWVRMVREEFRQISLQHMCTRAEAWEMLRSKMQEITQSPAFDIGGDEAEYVQEMLCGLREPTLEEAVRRAKLWQEAQPLQLAVEALLNEKKPQMKMLKEKESRTNLSRSIII